MLIQCLLGPTTQSVAGIRYQFDFDRAGRAVCEIINENHAPLFLARPEVYQEAERLDAPPPPPAPAEPVIVEPVDPASAGGGSPPAFLDNVEGIAGGTVGAPLGSDVVPGGEVTEMPPVTDTEKAMRLLGMDPGSGEQPDDTGEGAQQTPVEPAPVADPDVVAAAEGEPPAETETTETPRDPLDHDGDSKKGGAAKDPSDPWAALTVPNLEAFARENNVKLGQATRRADIIALLEIAGHKPPAAE